MTTLWHSRRSEDVRQLCREGYRRLKVSCDSRHDSPLAKSAPGVACTSRKAPCRGVEGSGVLAALFSLANGEPGERVGGVV